MTPTPWLSIITVVRDDPSGMVITLNSIAAQDLMGVEVVVVDSSRDASHVPSLLSSAGVDAQVVKCPPEGIYPAMNTGLEHAHGEYVYFLNAGDTFASPKAVTEIKSSIGHRAPTWLHGPVEIQGADGAVTITPPWDFASEQAHSFARGRFPAHQGTIARRDALQAIGSFDVRYRIAADYASFLDLSLRSAPVVLTAPVARFHEGGASTRGWARAHWEFHRARRKVLRPEGAAALRERAETAKLFVAAGTHRSPWALTFALMTGCVILLGATGVSWGTAALLVTATTLQGVAGAIWWRLLQPGRRVPIVEALGVGLGLGTTGALLVGLVWAWWGAFVLAVAAWFLARAWQRKRATHPAAPLAPLSRSQALGLLAGIIPGTAGILFTLRSYPLSWVGTWSGYHGDMAFFEALTTSVATRGLGSSIFMADADLRYHSLVYGWAGQLTMTVGAEPFVVLVRLLPIVTLIATCGLAVAWASRLSQSAWTPALASVLIVGGGFVGARYGSVLNFDSPSQSMSVVWLLTITILMMQLIERWGFNTRLTLIVGALTVSLLSFALTGGKASSAAIAFAAATVVAIGGLVCRASWSGRALVATGAVLVGGAVAYVALLSDSANVGGLRLFSLLDRASSVQGLNPIITERGIIAGIIILVLAVVPRWAGLLWLIGDRDTRWSPPTLFGIGAAAAGVGTIAVLSGGFNDLWFAVSASAPLAVLSAVGATAAAGWLGSRARTRVWWALIAGVLTGAAATALWASGSTGILGNGWRWAGPPVAIVIGLVTGAVLATGRGSDRTSALRRGLAFTIITLVAMALPSRVIFALAEPLARPQEGSMSTVLFAPQGDFIPVIDRIPLTGWTDTQVLAGRYLRQKAAPDDVIATNLTLHALVPALTQRATYVSNTHFQAPYGRPGDTAEVQQREKESYDFIDGPSVGTLQPFCAAGVDWVWVDPSRTPIRDWSPYAAQVFKTRDALILRIDSSSC